MFLLLLAASEAAIPVISVFGSSVANGYLCHGNCSGNSTTVEGGCYQSRLKVFQHKYGVRDVFNNAHNGDKTSSLLERFDQMLSCKPKYVLIALSLANEGILTNDPDKIMAQYLQNLGTIVTRSQQAAVLPVVALCYPNNNYNATHYHAIQQTNAAINAWNVPSVNFLGALDDGQGRWQPGFWADSFHPNDQGSTEMYYTLVPSIWDALDKGIPALPSRGSRTKWLSLSDSPSLHISILPQQIIHSFSFGFRFRLPKGWWSGQGPLVLAQISVGGSSNAQLVLSDHSLTYVSSGERVVVGSAEEEAEVSVFVVHWYARQSTLLYANAQLVQKQVHEQLAPVEFNIRGSKIAPVQVQEVLLYRGALSNGDVTALHGGAGGGVGSGATALARQASLEVFAPLEDDKQPLKNFAQSTTQLVFLA